MKWGLPELSGIVGRAWTETPLGQFGRSAIFYFFLPFNKWQASGWSVTRRFSELRRCHPRGPTPPAFEALAGAGEIGWRFGGRVSPPRLMW